MDYWVPGVNVTGVHEMVANALVGRERRREQQTCGVIHFQEWRVNKMYNGGKIIIGLIIFVGLVTYPLWNNMGKATVKPDPKIDTPEILKLPEIERKCIESKAYMKKEHMKLLNEWRDIGCP